MYKNILILFSYLMLFSISANAEEIKEKIFISSTELKELIEDKKIVSVHPSSWGSVAGVMLDKNGDKAEFEIDHSSIRPFVKALCKEHDIPYQYTKTKVEEYSYSLAEKFMPFLFILLFLVFAILTIVNTVLLVKIRKHNQ